ncbi:uncharacterized protein [Montipora capricornis]|uniref:uncharacterized protein n=1 Tax=Montipora capricornis TaxID=246305 RepID=UPI0035F13C2F
MVTVVYRATVDGWKSFVFHNQCDNKGPTVTIARKDSYLFGGFADESWESYSPPRSIPSTRSFLFSLKPSVKSGNAEKFMLLPGMGNQSIRGDTDRGPCWGINTDELCFNSQNVTINPRGVFGNNSIDSLGTFFTGEPSFQADELEVLVLEDSLCDLPCGEHEACDHITRKCVCDPTFRDEEICRLRQELQALRDEHCNLRWNSSRTDCRGRLFARYDVTSSTPVRAWRCYYEDALSGDRRRFDTSKNSICHQEDCNLTLEDPSSEISCAVAPEDCCRPLGMEGNVISDSQIIASSEHDRGHGARNARLNFQPTSNRTGACG